MKRKSKHVVLILFTVCATTAAIAGWKYFTKPTAEDLARTVIYGDTTQVRHVLDQGADVDGLDVDGRTALMEACYNGETETARLLIARGADVNKRVNDVETPLFCARFQPDIVKLLHNYGAKDTVDSKN